MLEIKNMGAEIIKFISVLDTVKERGSELEDRSVEVI